MLFPQRLPGLHHRRQVPWLLARRRILHRERRRSAPDQNAHAHDEDEVLFSAVHLDRPRGASHLPGTCPRHAASVLGYICIMPSDSDPIDPIRSLHISLLSLDLTLQLQAYLCVFSSYECFLGSDLD